MGKENRIWFLELYKIAWINEKILKEKEENFIIPIYRKGNEKKYRNYKVICFTSTAFKVYTKIVERRSGEFVEHKLEDVDKQATFRGRGRRTEWEK